MGSVELPKWQQIVEQTKAKQARLITAFRSTDTPADKNVDDSITQISSLSILASKIAAGELEAASVARAYIRAVIKAHEQTNCLTEILFSSAVERAEELDRYYQTHGKVIGPLHGVPVTLKDQYDIEGVDSTLGYVGGVGKPAAEDSVIVQLLKNMGAVLIAKTNLPQSIMWCETDNPLFGRTGNPLNPEFTPGGSTGGEGALLALNASILGWGTDIGGSIRIPSHMNGVYGLKPSSGRIPYLGLSNSTDGQEHVPSVAGPMARSLDTIHLSTKLIIDSKPWELDPKCQPIPWREDLYQEVQNRPLVIGLMLDDGVVKVHPAVSRVVKTIADQLVAAGHEIVPWNDAGHKEIIEIQDTYYTVDGFTDVKRELAVAGEPIIPHVSALITRAETISGSKDGVSVYDYWQLNKRKLRAQKAYMTKWDSIRSPAGKKVDILLTPVMPHSAVRHRQCKWVGYTKVWNVLDYSCIVLPGGKVRKDIDGQEDTKSYAPRNELDRWNNEIWDPEAMDGFPVGVQLVARRLEEEKVLGAAKVVEKAIQELRGSKDGI